MQLSHILKVHSIRNKVLVFFFVFLLVFAFYGIFLNMHFSWDSYSVFFNNDPKIQLRNTRYINYIILLFLEFIHINPVQHQFIFSLVLIFTVAYCIYYLSKAILTSLNINIHIEVLVICAVSLSFCNVQFLEWFLFPESTLFYSLSLLLIILSIHIWVNYQNTYFTLFLLLMSLFCYQATIAYFGLYSFIIILSTNNLRINRVFHLRMLKTILLIGFSCFLMLLCQKVFTFDPDSRSAVYNLQSITANLFEIIRFQGNLFYNCDGFFIPLLNILAVLVLCISISCFQSEVFKLNRLYFFLYLFSFYMIIFAPHVITSPLWMAPRTIVAYYSLFSILFITALISANRSYIFNIIMAMVLLFLLVGNLFMVYKIGVNHYISNYLDYREAKDIEHAIEKYEVANNISIKKIATAFDSSPTYSYPRIQYVKYDTNTRCFAAEWGDVNAINYYNQKDYIKIPFNPLNIESNLLEENWDSFIPEEQLFFIEDTLYWIKY